MFRVFVDDNFHLHDDSERDEAGGFATYAEAVAEAKRIVDKSLRFHFRKGMTADDLYDHYMDFGDDPFIRPTPPDEHFSAWGYAEGRCAAIVEEMTRRPGQ